jgi:hypothetical protein
MLVAGLAGGKVKVPNLGEMFDWRKAASNGKKEKRARDHRLERAGKATRDDELTRETKPVPAATDADDHELASAAEEAALPPIDPATMAHFISIQSVLDPKEAELARAVAADLSPAELRSWFEELKRLSVPQAVQKIRALVAGNTEAVP